MTQTAIQLYTLRDFEAQLSDIVHRVADAGFDGVEFAHRVREADPHAVREALDARDLTPVGAHVELPLLQSSFDELLDRCETIGCSRVVLPHVSSRRFRTTERVCHLATQLSDLADRLDDRGFELVYHNTRENFFPTLDEFGLDPLLGVDAIPARGWNHLSDALARALRYDESDLDQTGFGRLLAATDEETVSFEIDVKSVVAAGYDPADVFEFVGDRLSLVHVADIDRSRRIPPRYESVDPGTGLVDIEAAIEASAESEADWLVFEHDQPADPRRALRQGVETLSPHTRHLRNSIPS